LKRIEKKTFSAPLEENGVVYSVVVPVYNSEQSLPLLHKRLVETMERLGKDFEIVFVDDCSRDNSWQVLQTLTRQDKRLCALQLMRNYGQASATLCGLRQSRGHFVITIDDDLQNPPEEIPILVEALEKNPDLDVIIAAPFKKNHALWRNLGSKLVNLINNRVFKINYALKFTSFRILRRLVVNALLNQHVAYPAIGALLYSITPRIGNVYVRHEARAFGRSSYTFSKMLSLTLNNFLAFSDFPLRFLAGIGLVGIIASSIFGLILLIRYLTGGITVPGWITEVLLLVGISGFNFFAFGIVGEYLLRILQTVYDTPQYLVRQRTDGRAEPDNDHRAPYPLADRPFNQPEMYEREFEM
jgi:dolichol-phosphate mannosyltransferase/undecaprenyl-phosphate 4-deoxy-4-formamido-L-arabinose transferase